MSDLRYRGLCDPSDPRAIYSNVRFYLYNITNVDEMRQGAKPVVVRVAYISTAQRARLTSQRAGQKVQHRKDNAAGPYVCQNN